MSIDSFASRPIATKLGEDTPTTTGTGDRLMTRRAISRLSSGSSFCASPRMPRMVSPVAPEAA
jgi:hypothetical protein